MKVLQAMLTAAAFTQPILGDIYMHNPRGSNNRNCRTDNNKQRRNGNRLFDSENNDNGGYSCPRAFPFNCAPLIDNNNAFQACVNQNANPNKNMLDAKGNLVNPNAQNTPKMYYYSGSELSIEWTAQHGLGANDELNSEVIIQFACEDTLSDNCGEDLNPGQSPFEVAPGQQKCILRDGTPVRNADGNNGLNAEATDQIPDNANDQDDMRYGRHETFNFYQECKNRERNQGLYTADQQLQTNDARSTRQNPNGADANQRFGLECAEEAHYYPYWHYSPFKDIAAIVSTQERCDEIVANSQNVVGKGRCDCGTPSQCQGNGNQPNNPGQCEAEGFTWVEDPAHNLEAPNCFVGAYTRQNHLGNTGAGAQTNTFNWTLPQVNTVQTCVLRIRYNISSTDFDNIAIKGTAADNNNNSPLKDNDENEELTYVKIQGMTSGAQLGFALNTDQVARTFQDRSYTFEIHPAEDATPVSSGRRLQGAEKCDKVYNLNVRGKRGNIVQAYPAVEYDFTPSTLEVEENDCVHVQWTGSDYNPNRNGNNGEGGPYASNNQNKETKADRSNLVQVSDAGFTFLADANELNTKNFNMFDAPLNTWKRLAFLDQNIDGPECLSFQELEQKFNNRAEREEQSENCMKLSGQALPYFDAGPLKVGAVGNYKAMSTRNNNFSNRGQKFHLNVIESGTKVEVNPDGSLNTPPGDEEDTSSNTTLIVGIVAVAVVGVGFFAYQRSRASDSGGSSSGSKAVTPDAGQFQAPSPFKRVSTMWNNFRQQQPQQQMQAYPQQQQQWGGQQQQQQRQQQQQYYQQNRF